MPRPALVLSAGQSRLTSTPAMTSVDRRSQPLNARRMTSRRWFTPCTPGGLYFLPVARWDHLLLRREGPVVCLRGALTARRSTSGPLAIELLADPDVVPIYRN